MPRFVQLSALVIALAAAVSSAAGAEVLSETEFQNARKLYTAKCARCHKFYNPAKYSEPQWNSWMEKMSKKAKLKPDQKELLTRYLDTFRTSVTNSPGK